MYACVHLGANVALEDFGAQNYVGKCKPLLKQAGCTPIERNSFTKLLQSGFVDTFRHFHPKVSDSNRWRSGMIDSDVCFAENPMQANGCFSYWSVRAGNRPFNRGLRLDYCVASTSMLAGHKDRKDEFPSVVDSYLLNDAGKYPAFSDHCPIGCIIAGME